jgi:hypothetical protein
MVDPAQVQVVVRASYRERPETEAELEELLHDALQVMSPSEANVFLRSVRRALKSAHQQEVTQEVNEFLDGVVDLDRLGDPGESAVLVSQGIARDFARRRAVLDDTFAAPEAADMLAISRQAVTERWKKGKLIGFLLNDTLRLPTWQFDAQRRDGVIAGLPEVLAALDRSGLSPLNRIYWMTTPHPQFGDRTPVEMLHEERVDEVTSHAAGAGVW